MRYEQPESIMHDFNIGAAACGVIVPQFFMLDEHVRRSIDKEQVYCVLSLYERAGYTRDNLLAMQSKTLRVEDLGEETQDLISDIGIGPLREYVAKVVLCAQPDYVRGSNYHIPILAGLVPTKYSSRSLVILDGNHRVAAAIAERAFSVRAIVLDEAKCAECLLVKYEQLPMNGMVRWRIAADPPEHWRCPDGYTGPR